MGDVAALRVIMQEILKDEMAKLKTELKASKDDEILPPVDPKVIQDVKDGRYISLKRLRQEKVTAEKAYVDGKAFVREDKSRSDKDLTWPEFAHLFVVLIWVYLVECKLVPAAERVTSVDLRLYHRI